MVLKIYISPEDEWLIDSLKKIVESKKKMHLKSSLSWELLRIAKNGLINELAGASLDKTILTNGGGV